MNEQKKLKILYGYPNFPSKAYGDVGKLIKDYLERLNAGGFDVEGICLTLNPPAQRLSSKDLDRKWKRGDKELLSLYERVEKAIEGKDVFLNSSGINLHPEFIRKLPIFTVFQCFDDPESSEDLSKPVATSYDLCLVGNIAEVETYKSWGVKNVEWTPLGVMPEIYDTSLTYEQILHSERDIDLFMMIDRMFEVRKPRLDKLFQSFPDAYFYGKGWPRGYLDHLVQLQYLKRAKIGPNIHNSTGPINYRTFYLPANGVMQICDNKSNLGKIFELNKEVVGFDTVEECIDLCKYYLTHDEERRKIAANGWLRVMKDYTEIPIFRRNVALFEKYIFETKKKTSPGLLLEQYDKTKFVRLFMPIFNVSDFFVRCYSFAQRLFRSPAKTIRSLVSKFYE